MKSIFAVTFLVTMLLTAGTALSYDCYERNPPQIRPCASSQCQKPQCRQHHYQPCPTRCGQCDKCRMHKQRCQKQTVHQHGYQCQTTCTQKTEHVTTVQCKLCGTSYPKGVDHYCNRVQCRSCGQVHARDVEHRCGMVRCGTCGVQHPHGMRHRCGEMRSRPQDCSQGDCYQGNACRYKGKRCATRNCNPPRREETMETRWHTWFKNQMQEEAVL